MRDKKKTLKKVDNVRMEIKGDRTIININALGKEYKLAQAYANLRNLEFRAKEEIKLQTYADYLEIMKNRLKLKFTFEEKPRPKFPADEAYRDKKSTMHYPHGSMLVLVDSGVHHALIPSRSAIVPAGRTTSARATMVGFMNTSCTTINVSKFTAVGF